MYKYVLNSVVKISLFAQYFEYYAIIRRGPFFRGHTVYIPIFRYMYCIMYVKRHIFDMI